MGLHPHKAEKYTRAFEQQDRHILREAAAFYDPELNFSDNPAYVAKIKELSEQQEAEFQNKSNALASRTDRGWNAPSKEIIEQILKDT